jgi:steroid delta-isomerase-like uncharacterized protein
MEATTAASPVDNSTALSSLRIVRQFFAGLDAQDMAAVEALLSPAYTLHLAGTPHPMDRSGFRGFAQGFFAALPDVTHVIEDQFAAGEKVMTRIVVRGTHRGDFQGIAPTGRAVVLDAINVHYVEDGRVVEHWISFDSASLLRQLGEGAAPR